MKKFIGIAMCMISLQAAAGIQRYFELDSNERDNRDVVLVYSGSRADRLSFGTETAIAVSDKLDAISCGTSKFEGKIVKRELDLSWIYVEHKSGRILEIQPIYASISRSPNFPNVAKSWITDAQQQLTKVGTDVKIEYIVCGNAAMPYGIKSIQRR